MTKRLKVYLLILFAAACLACTLVGCKIGRPGRSELLAGYDTHVTYYSNGGYFDSSTTLRVREIYFKSGSDGVPFFEITEESRGMKVQRGSYDFAGWYKPATYPEGGSHAGEIIYQYTYTPSADDPAKPADKFEEKNPSNITVNVFPVLKDNGYPVTDSSTDRPVYAREVDGKLADEQILERDITVVCSDTRINSGDKIQKNIDDAHGEIVCANWLPKAEIEYILTVTDESGNIIDDGTEYADKKDGEKTFKHGDTLVSFPIAGNGEDPQTGEQVAIEGLTFVRSYKNAELSESLTYIPRPTDPDAGNPKVYCRYIVGDWKVVRNAEDVRSMFSFLGNSTPRKFFIINDITYTGTTAVNARVKTATAANATIVCDAPHTITGLAVNVPNPGNGMSYSMLGTISAKFSVSGLTLEDVNITIPSSNRSFDFYAICAGADAGAAAKIDLTIKNITATYEGEPTINNAIGDDRSNWLFGGADSDLAFLAQFTGVKLTGTNTLTLKEQQ